MLPNYLIVGAAKAGTNTLAYYLEKHPETYIVPQKEVNFFAADEIKEQQLYYKDFIIENIEEYKKLFEGTEKYKAVGEGSVSYLFYDTVPQKIKKLLKTPKIIILLRNPIERAYSHYLMDNRIGLVNLSFEEIISKSVKHKNLELYYQQFIGLSLYYKQVKRYVDTFGVENVKIYLFEDLTKKTKNILKDMFNFLEVDPDVNLDTFDIKLNSFNKPKGKIISKLYSNYYIRKMLSFLVPEKIKKSIFLKMFISKKPELKKETRVQLQKIFIEDINELELLTGFDLKNWKK